MANFYISLSNDEIASQIAELLNLNNMLYVFHNSRTIKNDMSTYFVEIGNIEQAQNKVIGCVGIVKESNEISRIHHVCTHPFHRSKGIARKLITLAINNAKSTFVYMTIRSDNITSLGMAVSLGFSYANVRWHIDHNVITVTRRTNLCKMYY